MGETQSPPQAEFGAEKRTLSLSPGAELESGAELTVLTGSTG